MPLAYLRCWHYHGAEGLNTKWPTYYGIDHHSSPICIWQRRAPWQKGHVHNAGAREGREICWLQSILKHKTKITTKHLGEGCLWRAVRHILQGLILQTSEILDGAQIKMPPWGTANQLSDHEKLCQGHEHKKWWLSPVFPNTSFLLYQAFPETRSKASLWSQGIGCRWKPGYHSRSLPPRQTVSDEVHTHTSDPLYRNATRSQAWLHRSSSFPTIPSYLDIGIDPWEGRREGGSSLPMSTQALSTGWRTAFRGVKEEFLVLGQGLTVI